MKKILCSLFLCMFLLSCTSGEILVKEKSIEGATKAIITDSKYKRRDIYRLGFNYRYVEGSVGFENHSVIIMFDMEDMPRKGALDHSVNFVSYEVGQNKTTTMSFACEDLPMNSLEYAQPDIIKIVEYLTKENEQSKKPSITLEELEGKIVLITLEDDGDKEWVVQVLTEEYLRNSRMFLHTSYYLNGEVSQAIFYLNYNEYLLNK